MRGILDQENQSIDAKKSEHPDGNLTTTFHKSAGEANPYVWFEYGPHKICNHTWGKVSGSMDADLINVNKQVNNKRCKYDN